MRFTWVFWNVLVLKEIDESINVGGSFQTNCTCSSVSVRVSFRKWWPFRHEPRSSCWWLNWGFRILCGSSVCYRWNCGSRSARFCWGFGWLTGADGWCWFLLLLGSLRGWIVCAPEATWWQNRSVYPTKSLAGPAVRSALEKRQLSSKRSRKNIILKTPAPTLTIIVFVVSPLVLLSFSRKLLGCSATFLVNPARLTLFDSFSKINSEND